MGDIQVTHGFGQCEGGDGCEECSKSAKTLGALEEDFCRLVLGRGIHPLYLVDALLTSVEGILMAYRHELSEEKENECPLCRLHDVLEHFDKSFGVQEVQLH